MIGLRVKARGSETGCSPLRLRERARSVQSLAITAAALAAAGDARAARPSLAGEATYGEAGGAVLVHFATEGADAVPSADADTDGVPDFVEEVAAEAEHALVHFAQLGFARPLDDGTLGGDGRIDIYLRDLSAADGNAGLDSCEGDRCIGFVAAENDYAGYAYPSRTEAIRSVIPHELFHLVQDAYSVAQPATWTEGTAVWAVENLYGTENGDFERFLPAFLERTYRPFERPVAGFGDGYAYGAALWPYFLERRYGVQIVVDAWTACATQPFLDATDTALGGGVDEAWTEHTRWNAFTGERAALGAYAHAAAWPEAPREATILGEGTVYAEGLSARYVPIVVGQRSRVVVASSIPLAAWLVADASPLDAGTELATLAAGQWAATVDAGTYLLVVTGLARGSIATAVDVHIEEEPASGEDGVGGCSAGHRARWLPAWFVLVGIIWRRQHANRRIEE